MPVEQHPNEGVAATALMKRAATKRDESIRMQYDTGRHCVYDHRFHPHRLVNEVSL